MTFSSARTDKVSSCDIHQDVVSGLTVLDIATSHSLTDHHEATELAHHMAMQHIGEVVMLSWHDRHWNCETPLDGGEHHPAGPLAGYVDYGVSYGASLVVVIEAGRFVFYFTRLEP